MRIYWIARERWLISPTSQPTVVPKGKTRITALQSKGNATLGLGNTTMDGLQKISGCDDADRVADVIFVHGLDGDARATWHPKDRPDAFWPAWLTPVSNAKLPCKFIYSHEPVILTQIRRCLTDFI